MSAGDSDFYGKDRLEMDQEHEGGAQDLMDTEEGYIKEGHSNTNPQTTAETGDPKTQELTEETEKLLKQLERKCKLDTSSTKEPVTKDYDGSYEKGKDELQSNSGNGCDLRNYPSTQIPSETVETVFRSEVDATALPFKSTIDESVEGYRKNPLLLNPVLRNVLKFLNIEDIKSARLVCKEWGSTGKLALGNCALIHFQKEEENKPIRLPEDFDSCFLESAAVFSSFKISGYLSNKQESDSWTVEELAKFFGKQQKYITELTLNFEFSYDDSVTNTDITPWISKSPMLQKDAKHLTKLAIEGFENCLAILPLRLILHIKDLALTKCKVALESGIKICPTKFKLQRTTFFQNEVKLDRVRINDFVDFGKAKEISLDCLEFAEGAMYVLDFWRKVTLDKLILNGVDIVNGETSEFDVEHLTTIDIPYFLNKQMNIKELHLSDAGALDLFTLPTSLQKLLFDVDDRAPISCSQPIVLENLQYLQIANTVSDFSFLSHFKNCPQLTFLKFYLCGDDGDINSILIPRSVKTLTLEDFAKKWVGESEEDYRKLEKLVVDDFNDAKELCEAKFEVDDFVVDCSYECQMDKSLVKFLEHRKRLNFGKRLYIGNLRWDDMEIKESVLLKYVDGKSSFYVFENGEKGRPVSEEAFLELLPKHINVHE